MQIRSPQGSRQMIDRSARSSVMLVYLDTTVYIPVNEVKQRLGSITTVYARSIILMYSQYAPIYTYGHPNPSRSSKR
jgi:hypothetical protein